MKWSEVWPLVIFLAIFLLRKQLNKDLKPVIIFLFLVLLLSIPSNIIANFNDSVPKKFRNNNIFYNLIAFLKVIFLGTYLMRLRPLLQYNFIKPLFYLFLVFTVLDFTLIEPVTLIGQYFMSAVSITLLIYCMTYFLTVMMDDETGFEITHPSFFICTGIALFESVNFFIYLFINQLFTSDVRISLVTWKISNYAYVISYLILIAGIYRNSIWQWELISTKKIKVSHA